MRRLLVIADTIDILSTWIGWIVSWLVIVFTLMIGYEVAARYLFNAPTKWAFDLSYMLGGSFFLLGQAYTLRYRQHVRIDIFYSRFSARTKALIDVFFYLVFFFPLWGGLLYALIPYVAMSWEIQERSMQGYWQPFIYPFKTVMPVGAGLFLLQGLADFLRRVNVLAGGEEHVQY